MTLIKPQAPPPPHTHTHIHIHSPTHSHHHIAAVKTKHLRLKGEITTLLQKDKGVLGTYVWKQYATTSTSETGLLAAHA